MKLTLIVIAVALSVLIIGCSIGGTNSSNTNSTNASSTKANTEPSKASSSTTDLKAEVRKAFEKFREVPFATVNTFDADKESDVIIEQYSASDSSFSRKAKNGESIEVIIFGAEEFSRMNSNWEWRKDSSSDDTAAERFFGNYDWIAEKYIPETDLKAETDETIKGKTAKLYKLTLSKPSLEVPTSIRIWIDKDRGLPIRIAKQRADMPDLIHEIDLDTPVKIAKPTVGKK